MEEALPRLWHWVHREFRWERFLSAARNALHMRTTRMRSSRRAIAEPQFVAGPQVRCIKNKLTREYEKFEARQATVEELEELGAGALRNAVVDGECERGSVMAGQIAGLVKEIKPVKTIIEDILKEAESTVERMNKVYRS